MVQYNALKVWSWQLSDGAHTPTKDVTLDDANDRAFGMALDRDTGVLIIADGTDDKTYAYTLP